MKEHVRTREINVLSDIKTLPGVRTLVARFLREEGIDKPLVIDETKLAIDEALTNIIKHSYQFQKGKKIAVRLNFHGDRLTVTLHDQGRSFPWEKIPAPDPQRYIREEREDGWGIFLMKKLMDEIIYHPNQGDHNEMIMVKYLKGGKGR